MDVSGKLTRITGKRQLVMAFCAGAALALVQAPWSFPLAFFFAIPLLFRLHAGAVSPRRAALVGWIAGLAYFGLTLSWLVEPFLVDAATQGWMAPFALFFMAAGLALFWALAFGLARRGSVIAFAAFWTLLELARSYLFTGFPWALVGYGWADTPVMQVISVIGVPGLGFLTILLAVLVGQVIRRDWRNVVAGLAILAVLWGFGSYRLSQPVPERASPFSVRVVQPNAAQELKWLPEFMQVFFDRQLALTAGDGGVQPDLVIWPEAAVPFIPSARPDLLQRMAAEARGARIAFGARRVDADNRWYNSLYLLDPLGNISAQYDKRHLVPFGEYFPLADRVAKLGIDALTGLTGTGFTAGEGPVLVQADTVPPFLPLICYEAIFAQDVPLTGPRPEWLLQITNDAWFGRFSGPYQHLVQARARAIEQGLPLVRSANTGVSVVTDPFGRILAAIPLGQPGSVDADLPAPLPRPLYSRTGDWPVFGILLLLAFWQLFRGRRRKSGEFS